MALNYTHCQKSTDIQKDSMALRSVATASRILVPILTDELPQKDVSLIVDIVFAKARPSSQRV